MSGTNCGVRETKKPGTLPDSITRSNTRPLHTAGIPADDEIVCDAKHAADPMCVDVHSVVVARIHDKALQRDPAALDNDANVRVNFPEVSAESVLGEGPKRRAPNSVVHRGRRQLVDIVDHLCHAGDPFYFRNRRAPRAERIHLAVENDRAAVHSKSNVVEDSVVRKPSQLFVNLLLDRDARRPLRKRHLRARGNREDRSNNDDR